MKALSLLLLLMAPGMAMAGDTMSRIVFRQEAPNIAPDSFAAKPKTLYQWGKEKGRVEEEADPEHRLTGLMIANGKDGWMINLADRTGRHFIDPGPTYNFTAPIVPSTQPNAPPAARNFCIGHELAFMASEGVKPTKTTHNEKPADYYQCFREGYTLRLYIDGATGLPMECSVWKEERMVVRLIYEDYESSLPVDPTLFKPPAGIIMSEAEATH